MSAGVEQRHGRGCARRGRCQCPWRAFVYSKRDGKKIRRTFSTKAAAVGWRDDARGAVRRKEMRAPTTTTLEQAAGEWFEGARQGVIRNRSGDVYKPSAIRGYEHGWRRRIKDELGHMRLSEITRVDVQDLIDQLVASGLSASTVDVTMLPLRVIFKRALERGEISIDPTVGVKMPRVTSTRDRVASPDEGRRLIAAAPKQDRALWATAMYAGLRRGELMALRIEDVDLGAGVIHVRRGWDDKVGVIETKSRRERKVPISVALRDYLDEHLLGLRWSEGLVFGVTASLPFTGTALRERTDRAWEAAKLKRITLHECRHTYASLMIAAGVNAKALQTYMGHANIGITLDKYGHLMPGNEAEAAGMLDAYLERQLAAAEGEAESVASAP